ncbi:cupredoxin domain-containing protein [Ideonella sp. BN130291]|uniref:cupredoxin domain-containing protein n=1 Tax=Ideonella sp. BN130291 TaxID=3112940 RepID=UPI002E26BBC8|nr:cupredoxin family protein [Ideonella sp. BN130291]
MKTPLCLALLGASLAWATAAQAHDKAASAPPAAHAHADDHGAAIGEAGDPAKATRTVEVDMTDNMRFTPASVQARQGETIRFVVKNSGRLKHEFVLGDEKALKQHAELMKKFPEMEHEDPNQVTVQPGQTGEVVWHFTKAGKVPFACLQPGHYDAGMKGQVGVAVRKAGAPAGHQH